MRSLRHSTFVALAATIVVSTAAAQPAPQPGEATFLVFLRGTQIGLERIELSRTPSGWLLKGSGRLAAPFDLTTRNYELRCTADWQPVDLLLAATVKGQSASLTSSFGLTTVISEISQGGQTQAKTDQITARAVVLPASFFSAYEALAVRLAGAQPGAPLRAYLVPQGEVEVQIRQVTDQTIQTPNGPVVVKRYAITLQRPDTPLEVEVWVDGRQRLARLEIPSASLIAARQDISSVMARAETTRNPGDQDVMIPASGFSLAATMTRPAGATGPLPAVVLVGASTSQDRDETTWRIPIFGQLAGALADAGVLAVRYDRRGVGQSGGRAESATIDDYAEDVRAVVRFLRTRKEVDRARIAVAGYGDGGWTALQAAAKDGHIRGLALVATMGTSGSEYTLERQQRELDRLGLSEADRQSRVELQKRIIAAATSGKGWDTLPPEIHVQADTPWFRSFLAFNPARVLAGARQPLLVVIAERDTEVPATHADCLVEAAKARKKSSPPVLARIAGVNHLLVPAPADRAGDYSALADQKVSPEIAKAIADWLGTVRGK